MRMCSWIAVGLLACSPSKPKDKPAAEEDVSEGERYARKARALFSRVAQDFHAAMAAGNLDAAHARLSGVYRQRVTVDQLRAAAGNPAFQPGVTYHADSSRVGQGMATAKGWIETAAGKATFELRCVHGPEGGWFISGLLVDGVSALP
jgi:hypothetical protein